MGARIQRQTGQTCSWARYSVDVRFAVTAYWIWRSNHGNDIDRLVGDPTAVPPRKYFSIGYYNVRRVYISFSKVDGSDTKGLTYLYAGVSSREGTRTYHGWRGRPGADRLQDWILGRVYLFFIDRKSDLVLIHAT